MPNNTSSNRQSCYFELPGSLLASPTTIIHFVLLYPSKSQNTLVIKPGDGQLTSSLLLSLPHTKVPTLPLLHSHCFLFQFLNRSDTTTTRTHCTLTSLQFSQTLSPPLLQHIPGLLSMFHSLSPNHTNITKFYSVPVNSKQNKHNRFHSQSLTILCPSPTIKFHSIAHYHSSNLLKIEFDSVALFY